MEDYTKLRLLGDRILCEQLEKADVTHTKSGIIVAEEEEDEKFIKAKVLKVGPDVTQVKEGDILYLGPYQYTPWGRETEDKKKLLIARDLDLDLKG